MIPATPTFRLLIIGDSMTLGATEVRGTTVVDAVRPTYVERLRDAVPGAEFVVDADVHRTTTAAKDKLEALLAVHGPVDAALLMVGGNDADMDWRRFVLSGGSVIRHRVPLEQYESNLRAAVNHLHAAGVAPVLVDLHNHDFALRGPYVSRLAGRDVVAMLNRNGGQPASDRVLAAYRQAVAGVAADLGVSLARYGETFDARPGPEVLGPDGVHPNAEGHRLIADALLPALSHVMRGRALLTPTGTHG